MRALNFLVTYFAIKIWGRKGDYVGSISDIRLEFLSAIFG